MYTNAKHPKISVSCPDQFEYISIPDQIMNVKMGLTINIEIIKQKQ